MPPIQHWSKWQRNIYGLHCSSGLISQIVFKTFHHIIFMFVNWGHICLFKIIWRHHETGCLPLVPGLSLCRWWHSRARTFLFYQRSLPVFLWNKLGAISLPSPSRRELDELQGSGGVPFDICSNHQTPLTLKIDWFTHLLSASDSRRQWRFKQKSHTSDWVLPTHSFCLKSCPE